MMAEGHHVIEYKIRVRSYGREESIRASLDGTLVRVLGQAFGLDRVDIEGEGYLLVTEDTQAPQRMPLAEAAGPRSAQAEIPGQVMAAWIQGHPAQGYLVVALDLADDAFEVGEKGSRVSIAPGVGR